MGECVGQVQTSRVHGAQLTQTLPTQQPGLWGGVLAALQQHGHQTGDDGLHRLTRTNLTQDPLLLVQTQSHVISQCGFIKVGKQLTK